MGNKNSGRRPQPTALKMLRGNPGCRKLNEHEPVVPPGVVEMPQGLTEDLRAVWERIAPGLIAMGTLTHVDVEAFVELCALQVTAAKAATEKARDGFSIFLHTTTVDGAGNEHQNVKVHPAIKLEGDISTKLRPYYEYFGMTPSARARLTVAKPADEPVSKWAGVLK